jgi:CDP-diacylglycerol--glycerol-3-phosphate 3-phosphatidyltransferase
MASIYALKGRFQNLLRPIVKRLAAWGVSANQVTLFTLLLCLAGGYWVWAQEDLRWLWLLPPAYFLRMALNAMDGMLAKEHNQASKFGAVFNEVSDFLGDAAMYWPFIKLVSVKLWWVTLGAAWATEIAGLYGATRRYDGPMGKSDRAFVFGAAAIFWQWSEALLVAITVLCGITIWNRLRRSAA